MTLGEALAELGVGGGADADSVRRAYLRLIKTRKPESDPAGFQRARQAYEIARAAAELDSMAAAGVLRGDGGGGEPEGARPEPSPEAAAARDRDAGAAPPPDAAPSPPPSEAFAGFLRAWQAVPERAGFRERLEIAREAVASLPADPRAHWLLVSTLSGYGSDADLAAALRAGRRAGSIEFLEALLTRVPRLALRPEIDAALASGIPSLRLAAAAVMVPWDAPRAVAVVTELARDAREGRPGAMPITRMLAVILALHENAPDGARAAHDALRAWLDDSGAELEILDGPVGPTWTLAEELASLPLEFPLPLRRTFAAAARAEDLSGAFYDACAYIHDNRREVRRWVKRLAGTAPNIVGTLTGALQHEAQRTGLRLPSGGFRWFMAPLLFALFRVCNPSHSHSPDPSHHYAPALPSARPGYVPAETLGQPAPTPSLELLRRFAIDLCGDDEAGREPIGCDNVMAMVEAFERGDCRAADRLRALIRKAVAWRGPSSLEGRILRQADFDWWSRCRLGAGNPAGAPARAAEP